MHTDPAADEQFLPIKKRPRGRPPKLDGHVRQRAVHLNENDWELAAKIGQGNASKGIRLALHAYKDKSDLSLEVTL